MTKPTTTPAANTPTGPSVAEAAAIAGVDVEAEAAAQAERSKLLPEDGKKATLRAVHGRIIHPFTQQEFGVDSFVSVVVDSWVRIQFMAGKLALTD